MSRPLRVFQLIKGLGRGGAERLLSEGSRYFDRERFVYGVGYFLPSKRHLAAELEAAGVEVTLLSASTTPAVLASVPRLARHLRAWRADLLHCHLPIAGVAGRLAARTLGMPVVYTEHNLIHRYHPLTRWMNFRTWRLQEQAVAVSEAVADSLAGHVDPDIPLEVVPNGVAVERFARDRAAGAAVRERLGIPPDAPVIGNVAVFRRQKRLDLWLRAAARIADRRPGAHWLLVGDGPTRAEVEALAGRLGLANRTHFVGLRDDVRPFFWALDVYLLSSDYEGLPVALLEAMAAGLPVVATAVGGVGEAVATGVTGILVPPGRPEELADAVLELLDHPDRLAAYGAAGHARVAEHHHLAHMVARYEAIYQRIYSGAGESRDDG